jgi:excisionase family DNA binding protein
MKDLRDWYTYLERSVKDPKPPSDSRAFPTTPQQPPAPARLPALPQEPAPAPSRRPRTPRQIELQQPLPMDLGAAGVARRAGRPPLTESRDAIIRRLLDPDLTLHEAASILNLSKATLRRYTDQGKLICQRTGGGQRRFKLSDVLALLEQRGEAAT